LSVVGAFEAKNTLGSLLDRVEKGEEIVITRHGKPVARLTQCSEARDDAAFEAVFDRMRVRARSLKLGEFDWDQAKRDRDDGRP